MSADLGVPEVIIAPRRRRQPRPRVGHFVGQAQFEHFLGTYRAGMAGLPPFRRFDVPTEFGTVRVYRFDGPGGSPVLLLPGRNASTPMYRANLPALLQRRTVYSLDLLGEAGLSVQHKEIRTADDKAQWLDETLAGLALDQVHLLGVSIGGWTATNFAVRRPGRAASLTLLDPVLTFAPIPVPMQLASIAMVMPAIPEVLRRPVLRWISGGADLDSAAPEAALISAGARDFVLREPAPRLFTDDQLRSIGIPVLVLIAGRSVVLDAARATERARTMLTRGEVELWSAASHAINGEYPEEVARRAGLFWQRVDAR